MAPQRKPLETVNSSGSFSGDRARAPFVATAATCPRRSIKPLAPFLCADKTDASGFCQFCQFFGASALPSIRCGHRSCMKQRSPVNITRQASSPCTMSRCLASAGKSGQASIRVRMSLHRATFSPEWDTSGTLLPATATFPKESGVFSSPLSSTSSHVTKIVTWLFCFTYGNNACFASRHAPDFVATR